MHSKLQITHTEVIHAKLPREMDGLKIAQISDLHFRRYRQPIEEELVQALNACSADLLVFTGDAVNHPRYWPRVLEWWNTVEGPAARYAVPGNWDRVRGGSREVFMRYMEAMGFQTLWNASGRFERGGGRLQVVGVDDVSRGEPDLVRAFDGVRPDSFTLMLSHNPDILYDWAHPRFDLLLCGHTHGGQIRLPGLGPLFTHTRMGKSFVAGLIEWPGERFVYVSRGIGTGRLKLRVRCPPELPVITLRRAREAPGGSP